MYSLIMLLYIYYFLNSLSSIQNHQLTNQMVKKLMALLKGNANLLNKDVLSTLQQ